VENDGHEEGNARVHTERHRLLKDYSVYVTLPVQWGEMDAYGHVNNAVLFRYFESARVAYLDASGFSESWEQDRIGAILQSTACRFRRPLFYPDTVQAGARVSRVDTDRFTMEYRVISLTHDAVAADGEGIVVSYDYTRSAKAPIPEAVRRRITELDGI
jgi:acyl-CoA thioester hydrolase